MGEKVRQGAPNRGADFSFGKEIDLFSCAIFLQDEKIAFSGAFNANKRMKSTSAVSSIRIIANRRESVKEA